MEIGGQTVSFLVDTGTEHLAVTQEVAPLSGWEVTMIGATGDQTLRPADVSEAATKWFLLSPSMKP